MSHVIYASFGSPHAAERAVGALLDHGVRKEDVSVVCSHPGTPKQSEEPEIEGQVYTPLFGYSTSIGAVAVPPVYTDVAGRSAPPEALDDFEEPGGAEPAFNDNTASAQLAADDNSEAVDDAAKSGISTTTSADVGEGAIKGTGWGAGIGIIAGLASMAIPGLGLVYGGGALALAIAGAVGTTVAGAAAGAVTGYLVDQGVDSNMAKRYEENLNKGGALVAVTAPSGSVSADNAEHLLLKYGAYSINASQTRGGGYVL